MSDQAEKPRLATLHSSASAEYPTPAGLVDRVVSTLGAIDLDPCAEPAKCIPATQHWTKHDDGLEASRRWSGRVFVNPPYGREVAKWTERFVASYVAGDMSAGLLLVAARPDTKWFQPLWKFPMCFVRGRLKFGDAENVAPFPSVVVYAGHAVPRFHAMFYSAGEIVAGSHIWGGWPRQAPAHMFDQ